MASVAPAPARPVSAPSRGVRSSGPISRCSWRYRGHDRRRLHRHATSAQMPSFDVKVAADIDPHRQTTRTWCRRPASPLGARLNVRRTLTGADSRTTAAGEERTKGDKSDPDSAGHRTSKGAQASALASPRITHLLSGVQRSVHAVMQHGRRDRSALLRRVTSATGFEAIHR